MPAGSARAAVERSLPLLQKSDVTFLQKSACVSCHNNSLTAMTVSVARGSGIPVDETIAKKQTQAVGAYLDTWRDRVLQGIGIPGDNDTTSYILLGLGGREVSGQRRPPTRWSAFCVISNHQTVSGCRSLIVLRSRGASSPRRR